MKSKGITLIALVITIIILLILAGVTIATLTGEGGILKKANTAKEENQEKTATEIINLKITNTQLQSYKDEEKMPDLQYLADRLYEDNEIQYIYNESQKNASTEKEKIIVTGETIFTKLNDYPYEFEIDTFLRLASVNGVKVADSSTVTVSREEFEELKNEVKSLREAVNNKVGQIDYDRVLATITTQNASYTATEDYAILGVLETTGDGFTASLYVNSILCGKAYVTPASSIISNFVCWYGKKGDIITTRSDHGKYDITIYALK